jgi:hypothetical protein
MLPFVLVLEYFNPNYCRQFQEGSNLIFGKIWNIEGSKSNHYMAQA